MTVHVQRVVCSASLNHRSAVAQGHFILFVKQDEVRLFQGPQSEHKHERLQRNHNLNKIHNDKTTEGVYMFPD